MVYSWTEVRFDGPNRAAEQPGYIRQRGVSKEPEQNDCTMLLRQRLDAVFELGRRFVLCGSVHRRRFG